MTKNYEKLNLQPKDGVLAYLIALAVTLLLGSVISFIPEGNLQTIFSYAITQIGFLIMPFVYLKTRDFNYLDAVPVKGKLKVLPLLLILPITIGAFMQNTLLSLSFNWLLELTGITPSVDLPSTDGALNVVLAIISVCILPALAEEFLFRGVMLSSYKAKGLIPSAIFTSVIFALSHFNLAQLVHQAILGFVLAYITIASGSVWYAVIMHLLNNLIALFIGKIIPAYDALAVYSTTNLIILLVLFVVGAVILILSLVAFTKTATKNSLKESGNPFRILSKILSPKWWTGEKFVDPYSVGIIVFMIILCLVSTLSQVINF